MNKATKHYRKRQIEHVRFPVTTYPPKIKIQNGEFSTNYLDITFEELDKIKEILVPDWIIKTS